MKITQVVCLLLTVCVTINAQDESGRFARQRPHQQQQQQQQQQQEPQKQQQRVAASYPYFPGPSQFPGFPGFPSYPGYPPTYPSPQLCDTCTLMETGFQQTLSKLDQLHSTVSSCTKHQYCPIGFTTIVGPMSQDADDAPSVVTCPVGYTVVECRCSREDRNCDGVTVTERQCTAYDGKAGDGSIRAIAQCAKVPYGTYTLQTATQGTNPVATCPNDRQVVACFLQNYWMHGVFVQSILDVDNNECKTSGDCSQGSGCKLAALCQAKY